MSKRIAIVICMNEDGANSKQIKQSILILYILLGGVLLFLVNKIPTRNTLYSFYTNYEADTPLEYPEAIKAITGENSRSYYNLGTLKTLRAYNEALGSTLSGLQKARDLITDAYKDLDTAEKIQLDTTLQTYIQENKLLSQKLGIVIQVKTCYGEYGMTIEALQNFSTTLDDARSLLQEEEKTLAQNTQINASCLENLKNINNASQGQLDQLQNQIQGYNKTYTSDFVDSIQDPIKCINQSMSDLGPTIDDANAAVYEFTQNHQNTITALRSHNKEALKALCDFAKNDANINEQIDNALEKLMQQLQNNLDQKNPSDSQSNKQEQNDIQYKNVFEEDELQLLQKIDANNKSLIQQIQNIKGEGRYNASKFINKLFEEFYGETGTLENILKPSNAPSQW